MRFLIDTTKIALASHFAHYNLIVDNGREPLAGEASVNNRPVIALCPITKANEPICEGAFSFAPLVQRALERESFDEHIAAAIDDEFGAGSGERINAAAKAMGEAIDGPDSYAQSSAQRRGHWRWLAELALQAAIEPPAARGLRAAAAFIDAHHIVDSSVGQTLAPRSEGNRAGQVYATELRQLANDTTERNFALLLADAVGAVRAFNDYASVNEAEFTGWGDGDVPAAATYWRVKSGQALKALEEIRPDYLSKGTEL